MGCSSWGLGRKCGAGEGPHTWSQLQSWWPCLLVVGLWAVPRISVSSSVNRGKEPASSEGLMRTRTSSTRPPDAGASEGSLFLSFVMEVDSFEVVHSHPPPHTHTLRQVTVSAFEFPRLNVRLFTDRCFPKRHI